ncbi:glycosyltransferase family 4 protein [Ideonella dechloratans]|uniref:glycosyltransferase family 4 protein n=1 Tax=Ideonella dechloratans TaxID=36863 RepID=UPI0035B0DAA8
MNSLLSINNYYYRRGGAEVVFLEQNALLEQRGWQVIPLSMRHEKNLPSPWSDYFVEEIEFGQIQGLAAKLKGAGKIIYSLEARRAVEQLVARGHVRLAHAHNVYHHLSPAIFGKLRSLGVPTVLTLHDLKIACPSYKMLSRGQVCERCKGGALWHAALQRCLKDSLAVSGLAMVESAFQALVGSYERHVQRFIVPSRFYIDKLVEWGWPRGRFTHVPNFIDPALFTPSPTQGEGFLFFGRLSEEKGVATLIRAAAQARVRLTIVGTGPQEAALKALVESLGAAVDFLGYRSGLALHQAIADCRAVVLPSEWYENAPMSVLEAYACGKPVIGARIGGIPELIREGETGVSFPSGDVEALAQAMVRMAAMSETVRVEMGTAARRWVEQEFNSARYIERLLAVYAELGVRE